MGISEYNTGTGKQLLLLEDESVVTAEGVCLFKSINRMRDSALYSWKEGITTHT